MTSTKTVRVNISTSGEYKPEVKNPRERVGDHCYPDILGDEGEENAKKHGPGLGGWIRWQPKPGSRFWGGTKESPIEIRLSGARALAHELGHAHRALKGRAKLDPLLPNGFGRYNDGARRDERENIQEWENKIARVLRKNDGTTDDRPRTTTSSSDPKDSKPPAGAIFWD